MLDVGLPSNDYKDALRRQIQDLEQYNELNRFQFILEEPDIREALVSALREYNVILTPTAYTFSAPGEVRDAYLLLLSKAYAYEMIYVRKLWNSVAYNDSGLSINETAVLSFIKALAEQTRTLAVRQIEEAKNADSINAAFTGGYGFEY